MFNKKKPISKRWVTFKNLTELNKFEKQNKSTLRIGDINFNQVNKKSLKKIWN
jgi:hypothetical protein